MPQKQPSKRAPNSNPILARLRCPVCLRPRAYLKATQERGRLYLACTPCGGKLIGERSVAHYLAGLQLADDVQFLGGWTRPHCEALIDYWLFRAPKNQVRAPREPLLPELALCRCPACRQLGAFVRPTKPNKQLYISCFSCGGRLMGEPMAVRYLAELGQGEIELKNGWKRRQLIELREFYRD